MTFSEKNLRPPLLADQTFELPVLPVRDTVIFPRTMTPLFVGRECSLRALEAALSEDTPLVAVTQIDSDVENPASTDLYTIGTEISVGRLMSLPDGTTNIMLEGKSRLQIMRFTQETPYLRAIVRRLPEEDEYTASGEALMRVVLTLFEKCVQLNQNIPDEAYETAIGADEPGWLADMIASVMDLDLEQQQQILDTADPISRLQRLSILLAQEFDVLELETKIQTQVEEEIDKGQREYFLREQMRAIQSELGELDIQTAEVDELRQRLAKANLPDAPQTQVEKNLNRLAMMPAASPETDIIRTYIDCLLELPWQTTPDHQPTLSDVSATLDKNHYGIPKVKRRILEHIAVQQRAGRKMRSPILCFVGPPGTGKTSLGQSIAEALGRKFIRVSLGGIRDEAEIRGHRRTYIGAMPGRIIQNMRQAGSLNPVFMLDEIDKVGSDFRGDPSAALLEVLDPEQNHQFADHYLDVPYDLSQVFFITTANLLHPIPAALQDRLELIEFSSYIEDEKVAIARQFIIPQQQEAHGLDDVALTLPDTTLKSIVRHYTDEAGVRNLDRKIGQILRKLTRQLAEGKSIPKRITANRLTDYLGQPSFINRLAEKEAEVGLAMGLAYTQTGGSLMPIEVLLMPGKGNLTLTGQLGAVMQESVQAALSFIRAKADKYGIKPTQFKKQDIHLHVPEGAIPKDGPSAGVAIVTALTSALSGRKVRHDVAMTGEITLRGRVLAVGGLKEKLLAAHRADLKTVIIPAENRKDLVDLPKRVQHELHLVFASQIGDVLETVFVKK